MSWAETKHELQELARLIFALIRAHGDCGSLSVLVPRPGLLLSATKPLCLLLSRSSAFPVIRHDSYWASALHFAAMHMALVILIQAVTGAGRLEPSSHALKCDRSHSRLIVCCLPGRRAASLQASAQHLRGHLHRREDA